MESTLPTVSAPSLGRAISRIGLGGMILSLPGRPDRGVAKQVVRTAVELGITLIDTADCYAVDHTEVGHNEMLIAETLEEMGLRVADGPVLVATKGGRTRTNAQWGLDGRPEHLRAACENSLRALNTDRIPLYQLHTPDPAVPLADSVGTLARMREDGKIGSVGVSNVTLDQIVEANTIVPLASVQNHYSVWDVGYSRSPIVEYCRREGIAFFAYAPLGGSERAHGLSESEPLARLAQELGASAHELALAWLMHQAPVVVPIPGASRPATIESTVRSCSISLDARSLRRLRGAFNSLPGSAGLLRRIAGRLRRLIR